MRAIRSLFRSIRLTRKPTVYASVLTIKSNVDRLLADTEIRLALQRTDSHGAHCVGTRCPCAN